MQSDNDRKREEVLTGEGRDGQLLAVPYKDVQYMILIEYYQNIERRE